MKHLTVERSPLFRKMHNSYPAKRLDDQGEKETPRKVHPFAVLTFCSGILTLSLGNFVSVFLMLWWEFYFLLAFSILFFWVGVIGGIISLRMIKLRPEVYSGKILTVIGLTFLGLGLLSWPIARMLF